MNSKVKKQLLVITIIFLIVINITALITIFYNSTIKSKKRDEAELIKEQRQIRGMRYYFKNELKLSEKQFEEFQQINIEISKLSQEIAQKLHEKRILMLKELAKENPDLKKLNNLANEIGELHYELKNNTIKHFLELKNICNEDQQEVLQQIFMQMINEQDKGRYRERNMRREKGANRNRRPNRPSNN